MGWWFSSMASSLSEHNALKVIHLHWQMGSYHYDGEGSIGESRAFQAWIDGI
jgi:hypothetical protein